MRINKLKMMSVAIIMSMLMAVIPCTQVVAAAENNKPLYIKEFILAEESSGSTNKVNNLTKNGYIAIKDSDGKNLDVNQKANANSEYAKDDMSVYICYKTTTDRSEAITDIALMNMKGGYDVHDYDLLMESNFKDNIIPFVDNFLAAIKEYRTNYKSSNAANKKRAEFIHGVLNKYTDDDCDKAGLGDLLLNETKYEMGDDAYDKLSKEDKNKHADILTIIAQANGQSALTIENAITRACDTNDNTWIDRFLKTTYDDLVDETELSPSKAKKELDKLYFDDAETIYDDMLSQFVEYIDGYDDAKSFLDTYDKDEVDKAVKAYENMSDNEDENTKTNIETAYTDAMKQIQTAITSAETVAIYDYLSKTKYGDETMLDFFKNAEKEAKDDKSVLYPMVASLTEGQRAGLDFVSLKELVSMAIVDPDDIKLSYLDQMKTVSIYAGVDRGIFEKGGVGLTSDAIRNKAADQEVDDPESTFNALFYCSVVSASLMIGSAVGLGIATGVFKHLRDALDLGYSVGTAEQLSFYFSATSLCSRLLIAVPIVCAIVTVILLAFTIDEAKKMYNIEYDSIPRYMVDEKDIVEYNSKGEKIVRKNQSAYYKVVECTRNSSNEMYASIGNSGDLNGTIGKQWLAMYYEKNEANAPILADSLMAVVKSKEVPAGYKTGLHMFGTEAAENLNNTLYVWNSSAPKIYVYYKTEEPDTSGSGAEGSSFTAGYIAIAGGAGLLIGSVVTAICMNASKKKKKEETK